MIERNTHSTPTQERVGLINREVTQRLVTTDVEGSQHDGHTLECFQNVAIDQVLFFLTGETIPNLERDFGPVEAYPFSATSQ